MAAYNGVNGDDHDRERRWCATSLKDEWGFDGVAMSDWYATRSTGAGGELGLDLAMPGPAGPWGDALVAAVRDGRGRRGVGSTTRCAGSCGWPRASARSRGCRAGRPTAARLHRRATSPPSCASAAAAGFVLVRNDGPAAARAAPALRRVAVIGPNAAVARTLGGGSATVFPPYTVSPLDGLRAALAGRRRCDVPARRPAHDPDRPRACRARAAARTARRASRSASSTPTARARDRASARGGQPSTGWAASRSRARPPSRSRRPLVARRGRHVGESVRPASGPSRSTVDGQGARRRRARAAARRRHGRGADGAAADASPSVPRARPAVAVEVRVRSTGSARAHGTLGLPDRADPPAQRRAPARVGRRGDRARGGPRRGGRRGGRRRRHDRGGRVARASTASRSRCPGRQDELVPARRRRQPAHRRGRQPRGAGAAAVGRRGRRGAARLVPGPGVRRRARRRAARRRSSRAAGCRPPGRSTRRTSPRRGRRRARRVRRGSADRLPGPGPAGAVRRSATASATRPGRTRIRRSPGPDATERWWSR